MIKHHKKSLVFFPSTIIRIQEVEIEVPMYFDSTLFRHLNRDKFESKLSVHEIRGYGERATSSRAYK